MKSALLLLTAALLAGCATRATVEAEGIGDTLSSNLSPSVLARCIANNMDGRALGSVKASIESEAELRTVVLRTGDNMYGLIKIRPYKDGSRADIYYGGAAKLTPGEVFRQISEGCA